MIGALVGVVVSLFRLLIELFSENTVQVYLFIQNHLLYLPILVVAMVIFALINSYLMNSELNIKGSGIPQVEGQLQGLLPVNWFSVLWKKFVGGVLAVGSGLF